jgi:DNA helicase HerA-like ATPase
MSKCGGVARAGRLDRLRELLARFYSEAAGIDLDLLLNEDDKWQVELPVPKGGVRADAAARLYASVTELAGLVRWDLDAHQTDVLSCVQGLSERDANNRVVCLDLASLERPEARLIVADAALNSLWSGARESWVGAISNPPEEDARCPVFIVIDEAHNLAPAEPATWLARAVNDTLVRIATEGRKYGLFLILATQRPSRLNRGVLSQCDNLCLMKMNNRSDLRLVEKGFGFLPDGWARRALEFKTGDALLDGNFVEGAVYAHIAPRRTAEGGRSLQRKAWLQDPFHPAAPSAT